MKYAAAAILSLASVQSAGNQAPLRRVFVEATARLLVPTTKMLPPMGGATELPVSLMIARDTDGA
jgi:uncharacterized protein YggT (Ycf19 family)